MKNYAKGNNLNFLKLFLILFLALFVNISSYSTKEKKEWFDAFLCVDKRHLKQIEQKFGLVAEGTGWSKQEGLRVPLYTFICYKKMKPEEVYELYFNVTSFLQKIVSKCLSEKGLIFGKDYTKIPLKFSVLFFTPKREFQPSPYVAAISIINDYVSVRFKQSTAEPLQTLIKYPLKEFEEKVFRASEDICEPYPTSHQSLKIPMRYRRCSS